MYRIYKNFITIKVKYTTFLLYLYVLFFIENISIVVYICTKNAMYVQVNIIHIATYVYDMYNFIN